MFSVGERAMVVLRFYFCLMLSATNDDLRQSSGSWRGRLHELLDFLLRQTACKSEEQQQERKNKKGSV